MSSAYIRKQRKRAERWSQEAPVVARRKYRRFVKCRMRLLRAFLPLPELCGCIVRFLVSEQEFLLDAIELDALRLPASIFSEKQFMRNVDDPLIISWIQRLRADLKPRDNVTDAMLLRIFSTSRNARRGLIPRHGLDVSTPLP